MHRLIKTTFAILLALTLSMSGCGSKESAAPSAQHRHVKVGVSIPAPDHLWTQGVKWWAEQSSSMYPDAEILIQTGKNSDEQKQQIQDLMVQKVDALVILPTDSDMLTPIARQAHDKGIYIVNVDRGFSDPSVADLHIEGDNRAFGRKSAQFMCDRLNHKGNIVVLEGIHETTVNQDRVNAALEVFRANNVTILAQQPANWNRTDGKRVMKDLLQQYANIDAVWAGDDDTALGAIQAIKEAHRDNVWAFGGAGMKEVVKMILDKDPMVPGDVTYPPSQIATGIHLAISALRDGNRDKIDKFMPRHLIMDVDLITPDNARQYYFPDSVY